MIVFVETRFRGKAIEPFMKMQLTLQDFDNESGQCDGTLAHGIERLFPYFAEKNGFSVICSFGYLGRLQM